jgi:hypothetical protein
VTEAAYRRCVDISGEDHHTSIEAMVHRDSAQEKSEAAEAICSDLKQRLEVNNTP